jgi:penicillin-binding protein 2
LATTEPAHNVLRLTFLSVVVIGLFLALFSRLWFLQVLAGDRYALAAEENRERLVVTEAPRGRILDAGGQELVANRPAITISADRQLLLDAASEPVDADAERILDRLAKLLLLDRAEIVERLTSRRYSPFRPIPIAIDVSPEIAFAVRERQELFPGVVAETLPVRTYPQGEMAAHLVGYLGEITEEDLAEERFADYRPGELIGRGGLESVYEGDLRGDAGRRILEVNRQDRVLDVLRERDPVPGNDLQTSLDLDLQAATERLLEEGIIASRDIPRPGEDRNLQSTGGSAIVMDPRDGSILAMASYPTFDVREFAGGVSQVYYDEVTSADNERPLFNRPIQATHPPGSVFKIVTGAAFLQAELVGPSTRVNCPGSFEIGPQTFNNWNAANEGPMALAEALWRSCDTYFYDLAYTQWQREERQDDPQEILDIVAGRFGFGERLGIDLPGEQPGVIPGREWREQYHLANKDVICQQAETESDAVTRDILADLCVSGGIWRPGDAVNRSIGQGDVLTTPLQVAASYMAIANGGTVYRPHIGQQLVGPDGEVVREIEPEVVSELELSEAELGAVQRGVEGVVMHPRGTGRSAFTRANAEGEPFPLEAIPVAGKTGTAEMGDRVPYAWFASYAPADDPEVVVVVNVEEGGGGSQTAAPIARNILDHYFGLVDAEDAAFATGDAILD